MREADDENNTKKAPTQLKTLANLDDLNNKDCVSADISFLQDPLSLSLPFAFLYFVSLYYYLFQLRILERR